MKRTVAIVGTGWVGSSIAISTLHSGVADELLLNDLRMDVAEGDAMDLAQGASFYPPATVRAVSLDEIATAMRKTAERVHVVAEGAGATAIAAALSGRAGNGKVVAVVSGGNIDLTRFAELVASQHV